MLRWKKLAGWLRPYAGRPVAVPVKSGIDSSLTGFSARECREFFNGRIWLYLESIATDDLENIRSQLEVSPAERARWSDTEFQPDDQLRGAAKALRQFLIEWPSEVKARINTEENK